MTIQFKVSFQKEKMMILLQLYYPYDKYLLFFCSLFVDLYSCKSSVFTASTLKEFIIQGPYSAIVCIIRLHGLEYKEKTNIFK